MEQITKQTDVGMPAREGILRIASGESVFDRDFFLGLWNQARDGFFSRIGRLLAVFLLPGVICAAGAYVSEGRKQTIALIGNVACAATFLLTVRDVFADAKELFSAASTVSDAAFPVLTTLTALSGQTAAAAMLTPSAAFAGELIVEGIQKWGMYLCSVACAVCAVNVVSGRFRLDGLFSLLKSAVHIGCGLLLALFVGILKVQGLLSSNFDSAAMKTAQFAFDKMIPVIGGRLADSMDVTLSGVLLVKSAAGVTGLCLLLRLCAVPILRIWSARLALRCAGAVLQPMGSSEFTALSGQFADVLRMLLLLCLTAVTVTIVLLGAAIRAGGELGV